MRRQLPHDEAVRVYMQNRLRAVLMYIKWYIEDYGESPTSSQIGRVFGVKQPAAANYVKRLEAMGKIKVQRGSNFRTITVVNDDPAA